MEHQGPERFYSFLTFTFTFSHLADAFIQSDLHTCDLQCIHILHFTLMAHCTSGAIRGSVSCSRTLQQGISNLLITKQLLYLQYHCRPHPTATTTTNCSSLKFLRVKYTTNFSQKCNHSR